MSNDFMSNSKSVPMHRNTLSLEGALYQRLLAKLDERGNTGDPNANRVFRRLSYAHQKLVIHVESEGHNERTLIVATRNLSQGGISILHSSFMYTGTGLTVELIDYEGNTTPYHGTVTRCEHRGGRVHEIGIKFDSELVLRKYLDPNPKNLLHSREKVCAEKMNIKLLICSPNTDFSSLMRQYLLTSSLQYKFVKTEEELFELYQEQDMLFFELDKATMQTPEMIRKIRESGYANPIILAGRPTNDIDTCLVRACGADLLIPWPSDEQTVLCSIGEYVFNEWTSESLENIRSCISPETKATLRLEITKIAINLDQCIRAGNRSGVLTACSRIRMLAPLLNLVAIQSAINQLTDRVGGDESLESIAPELTEVIAACTNLRQKAA